MRLSGILPRRLIIITTEKRKISKQEAKGEETIEVIKLPELKKKAERREDLTKNLKNNVKEIIKKINKLR
jgi:hypothetical protein